MPWLIKATPWWEGLTRRGCVSPSDQSNWRSAEVVNRKSRDKYFGVELPDSFNWANRRACRGLHTRTLILSRTLTATTRRLTRPRYYLFDLDNGMDHLPNCHLRLTSCAGLVWTDRMHKSETQHLTTNDLSLKN